MIDRLNAALEGRYRIERKLGEGGMATVFLAEDVKHHRKVALKILKPELAAVVGAERFLTEIETTANLQHPHILPLFDSGEADGFLFYVMPYVEGESLREKLEREHQLPVEDALGIAEKVAAALQYAHEQGVVHRDIKPANILLSRGEPVVADFGIALALSEAGDGRITETGLSLGTPHYMSPEQAAGERTLDKRSDVYALGCVLYEMLTGQPPFGGPSAQAVLGRILTGEADRITEHRKSVPSNVEAAVHASLERLPADRFESAAAFAAALRNPSFGGDRRAAAAPGNAPSRGRRALLAAVGLALLVATFVAGWTTGPTGGGVLKQRVELWRSPVPVRGEFYVALAAAIAPDGSAITYTDFLDGRMQLFSKPRGEMLASAVAGTEGGAAPAYSPDGEWLAFVTTDFELRKVRSGGGGSVTVAEDVSALAAPHWLDDHIYYVSREFDIARVGENGGDPETILSLGARLGQIAASVHALPGGRGLLFTGCAGNCNQGNVYLYDMATDSVSLLFEDAHGAWYLPTGHVAYVNLAGGLFAAPFDVDGLRVTGGAVAVIPDVAPYGFVFGEQGTVVYGVADVTGVENELVWVTLDGRTTEIDPDWRGRFAYPDVSPDGTQLAVSIASGGDEQIWVKRLDRGPEEKLTAEGNVAFRPEWSADGGSIAYVVGSDDLSRDLYVRRADGSSDAELLLDLPVVGVWEAEYSKDGRWLMYRTDQGTTGDLYALSLETGDTVPLLTSEHDERQAALSPDGRWLAYISDRSGRYEVYVRPFPNTGEGRTVISSDGGSEPVWSPDGTRLFYRESGMMKAVEVLPGAAFRTGAVQDLFGEEAFASAFNRRQYDIHPDGSRFAMIRYGDRGGLALVYGENWFEELRERLDD
jgi:Tol biopolymer transport system component